MPARDPFEGIGGAAHAESALTLRLVLACFGLLVCAAGAAASGVAGAPVGFTLVLGALAVVAAVDAAVRHPSQAERRNQADIRATGLALASRWQPRAPGPGVSGLRSAEAREDQDERRAGSSAAEPAGHSRDDCGSAPRARPASACPGRRGKAG